MASHRTTLSRELGFLGKNTQSNWRPAAVVAACFVGAFCGPVVTVFYTLGLFMAPLSQEFGWSTSQISLVIPIHTVAVAVASIVIGSLIDRHGARRVILVSMTLYGCSMFLFGFVNSFLAFCLMYMLVGICAAGSNTMSFVKVLTRWFNSNRGLMIGLAASGSGIGTLALSPYAQFLIEQVGWRGAYAGLGIIILLFGLPIMAFGIRNSPTAVAADDEAQTDVAAASVPEGELPRLASVLRQRAFWLILTGFMLAAGAVNAAAIYLSPIIQGNGDSLPFSVLCVSSMGFAALAGRIGTGFLLDRFRASFICAVAFTSSALAILILREGATSGLAIFSAVLIGLSLGAEGDALGYLASRYFPIQLLARVYSIFFAGYMASLSVVPLLVGVARDHFGDYHAGLLMLAGLLLLGAATILCLGPYPRELDQKGE